MLQYLDLSCNPLGSKILIQLAKLGKTFKSLSLFKCELGFASTNAKKESYQLKCEHVNISYNPGIQWAMSMFGWENLKEFEAIKCELSDAQGFVDALVDSKKLEVVNVSENPFDDHFLIAENLLENYQKLETLNLCCTTISERISKNMLLKVVANKAPIPTKLKSESISRLDLSGIIGEN